MIPFWRVLDAPDYVIQKPLVHHFKRPADFVNGLDRASQSRLCRNSSHTGA